MPFPTPFHDRTSALCTSMFWKEWAGHYTVKSYGTHHDAEYVALRHSAGLIDVTPLYKYEVTGPDAGAFLARVMVKDLRELKVGRVTYLCWCDDDGMVMDDGTVTRLDENHYRVTAAEPCLAWFQKNARRFDVSIEDSTQKIGALSLQGPTSRDILAACSDVKMDKLRYFRSQRGTIDGAEVIISRTGYTGDLGYEVWCDAADGNNVYDAITEAGQPFRITPCGLDAMDVARVEAGFIMNGVDYFSANHCPVDSRKSTPFELGLGWTVKVDREPFVGQRALQRELETGSRWAMVGLVLDWDEYEALWAEYDLPPQVCTSAWRDPRPVYTEGGVQVGRATSGAWSPQLKKDLALASVSAAYATPGTRLRLEVTAEWERRTVLATVTETPFFDPERKRSLAPAPKAPAELGKASHG